MKIVVVVCATKDYTYAMSEQAARVAANFYAAKLQSAAEIVCVGDDSVAFEKAVQVYQRHFSSVHVVRLPDAQSGLENYKEPAQRLIGRMRSHGFSLARQLNASFCWSLDSDVLPPNNALRCMLNMLDFDAGYYGVSACPYPSQGNGDFLCGRGTPEAPISPDWLDSEKQIPEARLAVLARLKKLSEEAMKDGEAKIWENLYRRYMRARRACEKYPPKCDVFEANSKGKWRRRGWFSQAYPAVGIGAVVPSDWCGFGCTLMGKEALSLAIFDGYSGGGTEDLFVVWQKWWPAGIRIAAIPHCPCDHVVRGRKKGKQQNFDEFLHVQAFHETQGECIGHLRRRVIPWRPIDP